MISIQKQKQTGHVENDRYTLPEVTEHTAQITTILTETYDSINPVLK